MPKLFFKLWVALACLFPSLAQAQSYDFSAAVLPALTNSVVTVKATKGPLLWYICVNKNAADAWVQIFDSSIAVVLGTTVPARSIQIAGASTTGLQQLQPPFAANNSIQVAATTTVNGAAAPVTALSCEFGYH